MLEEILVIDRRFGTEAENLHLALGRLLTVEGDMAAARSHYQESLNLLFKSNVTRENVAASLDGLEILEVNQGVPGVAAQLWGAAEALRDVIEAAIYPVYQASYEQSVARVRAMVGEQTFYRAWIRGKA